jgi:hypothetical protein
MLRFLGCSDCDVEVSTQTRHGESQPDIKLVARKRAVCVEVKVEADVTIEQLERHLNELRDEFPNRETALVLITKRSGDDLIPESFQIRAVRWYEIAAEIAKSLPQMSAVSQFLAQQFLEFLEVRGMTMKQVKRELTAKREAVSSFANLMEMLNCSLLNAGFRKGHVHEHLIDGGGFFFGREKDWGPYWCGIDYDNPENVYFHAYDLQGLTLDRARSEGWSVIEEGKRRYKVCRKAFALTDDFFKRPAIEQLKQLTDFIGHSRDEVDRIKTATGPTRR